MLLHVATEWSQTIIQLFTLWAETPFLCEAGWLLFLRTNAAGDVNLQESGCWISERDGESCAQKVGFFLDFKVSAFLSFRKKSLS